MSLKGIAGYFQTMVKGSQAASADFWLVELDTPYDRSMELFVGRVNQLMSDFGCQGFKCFVMEAGRFCHADSQPITGGELLIPKVSMASGPRSGDVPLSCVMGCIATTTGLFEGLVGTNPFNHILLEEGVESPAALESSL